MKGQAYYFPFSVRFCQSFTFKPLYLYISSGNFHLHSSKYGKLCHDIEVFALMYAVDLYLSQINERSKDGYINTCFKTIQKENRELESSAELSLISSDPSFQPSIEVQVIIERFPWIFNRKFGNCLVFDASIDVSMIDCLFVQMLI